MGIQGPVLQAAAVLWFVLLQYSAMVRAAAVHCLDERQCMVCRK